MSPCVTKTCTQQRLRSAWASVYTDNSLCSALNCQKAKGLIFLNAYSEDSDQTGLMPRLTCISAGLKACIPVFAMKELT